MVSDVRMGKLTIETRLPTELTLMKGSQGDIARTVQLPKLKYSPWIGKGKAEFGLIGTGVRTDLGTKQLIYIGEITKTGKVSVSGELQVVTGTKGDKYAVIESYAPARRDPRDIKMTGQPPVKVREVGWMKPKTTVVEFDKSISKKIEGTNIKLRQVKATFKEIGSATRRKFVDKLAVSRELGRVLTVKEAKALAKKGTIVSTDIMRDVIITDAKTPFEVKLEASIGGENFGVGARGVSTGTSTSYWQTTRTVSRGVSSLDARDIKVKTLSDLQSQGTKTPLSETFGVDLTTPPQKLVSLTGTEGIQTVVKVPSKVTLRPEYPLIVQSGGTSQSIYQPTYVSTLAGVQAVELEYPASDTKGLQLSSPSIKLDESPKIIESPAFKGREDIQSKEIFKQPQASKQVLQLKQIQIQETKQLQRQASKQLEKQVLKPKPQPPSKPIKKKPDWDFMKTLKQAKKELGDEDKFEVFVMKLGKDIKLEEDFATLGRAKKELVGKLRGTLRASGFITKGGKKIKAGELRLFGREFRPSKKDPFRIVERKERRIKKGTGEIGEILAFRGSKRKLFRL